MALLGQKAENKWVGVNCGIMDQLISAVGQKDHAVLMDCRSLDLEAVPTSQRYCSRSNGYQHRRGSSGFCL